MQKDFSDALVNEYGAAPEEAVELEEAKADDYLVSLVKKSVSELRRLKNVPQLRMEAELSHIIREFLHEFPGYSISIPECSKLTKEIVDKAVLQKATTMPDTQGNPVIDPDHTESNPPVQR